MAAHRGRSRPGACRQDDRVDIVLPTTGDAFSVELPAVTVSDVVLGDQDLRFSVDQIGVPVLVRMSYFPNWEVSGAEGAVPRRPT